jgi:hypothetical protein
MIGILSGQSPVSRAAFPAIYDLTASSFGADGMGEGGWAYRAGAILPA